jgi:hypothetical protein
MTAGAGSYFCAPEPTSQCRQQPARSSAIVGLRNNDGGGDGDDADENSGGGGDGTVPF